MGTLERGTDAVLTSVSRAAEEHGGGKIQLLERGGYDDMDVCLM